MVVYRDYGSIIEKKCQSSQVDDRATDGCNLRMRQKQKGILLREAKKYLLGMGTDFLKGDRSADTDIAVHFGTVRLSVRSLRECF
jgi:hypothetical protein